MGMDGWRGKRRKRGCIGSLAVFGCCFLRYKQPPASRLPSELLAPPASPAELRPALLPLHSLASGNRGCYRKLQATSSGENRPDILKSTGH